MTDREIAEEWDAAIADAKKALNELADRTIRPTLDWIAERLRRHPETETFCPGDGGEWAIVTRGLIDRTPRCSMCGGPVPTTQHPILRLTNRKR